MGQIVRTARGARIEHVDGGPVLLLDDSDPIACDEVTATVLRLINGERDVAALTAAAGEEPEPVAPEQVWSSLDLLADLGALEGRAVPPAGGERISRRALLGRAAVGGAVVVGYPIVTAGQAAAHPGLIGGLLKVVLWPLGGEHRSKEAEEQQAKQAQEQQAKQAQEQQEKSQEQQTKQAQEQQAKSQEQQAKQAQEEQAKGEQQAKQAQEQQAKQAQEQQEKSQEQQTKQAQEEQAKGEQQAKHAQEQQTKQAQEEQAKGEQKAKQAQEQEQKSGG